MTKEEIIETIFKTQIECDKKLERAGSEFGMYNVHTIGLTYASVESREIISRLDLDEAFFEYKEAMEAG